MMQYRVLGRTDLKVSLLGFGAAPLGDVYGVTDPTEGKRAVHFAIERGINFFDSSPYYGLTLSEERLGQPLVGRRDKVILATKCGRYGFDAFDFSAKRITASIDESLQRLRTDYVDLLQAHDVEFGVVDQVINETVPAMRKLQEQGKARFIGITGYHLKTLVRIAQAVPVDTVLSFSHYNLMITDMDDVLTPFAKRNGIGLINAAGLHMGILTEAGPPAWHPAPAEVREAGGKVARLCRERGHDVADVALRFCLDHPYVSSTLVGMPTQAHVKANLNLLGVKTDSKLLQETRSLVGPLFNYVWRSGRPENQG
jgi:aryl-alcohol dehydrogenase-like predicted oxidoreductase